MSIKLNQNQAKEEANMLTISTDLFGGNIVFLGFKFLKEFLMGLRIRTASNVNSVLGKSSLVNAKMFFMWLFLLEIFDKNQGYDI